MKNKKFKKAIWMYAVVLFTSAFILLLFTYYSQNKLDKNLNDYINKLSIEEKKKISFQTDLFSVTEDNKDLKNQIDSLKKELKDLKNNKDNSDIEQAKFKEIYHNSVKAYENLIYAENEYLKGNIIECAEILLNNCDHTFLDINALEKYNNLVNKTFFNASQKLYVKGLENYKNSQYKEAVDSFKESISFSKENYLTDDCYYFIAYSYFNMGNKELAKNNLEILIKDYPDSSYKIDSLNLLKQLLG